MWMRRGERPCDGTLYTTKAVDPHTTGAKGFRFCPVKSAPGCRSSWFVLTILVRPCGNPPKGVSFHSSADSQGQARRSAVKPRHFVWKWAVVTIVVLAATAWPVAARGGSAHTPSHPAPRPAAPPAPRASVPLTQWVHPIARPVLSGRPVARPRPRPPSVAVPRHGPSGIVAEGTGSGGSHRHHGTTIIFVPWL